jgi:uncharacterized repeat protein (TIGR01451 family)
MSTASHPRHLVLTLALAGCAALGLLGPVESAWAGAPAPQLSIAVDDGQTEARSATTLRYAVTVTNLGTKPVRNLQVSQTAPSGTTLVSVDSDGTKAKGTARWSLDVPAGKTVTVKTSVKVGANLPADLLRLAAVACASTGPKAPPTVCASDSDQLPAGAAAEQQQRRLDAAGVAGRPAWLLPVAGIALGALLIVGLAVWGFVVRGRRRHPGRSSGVRRRSTSNA